MLFSCLKTFNTVVTRNLRTSSILSKLKISSDPDSAALILGVYTFEHDLDDAHIHLTKSGERFDNICNGRLFDLLSLAKPVPRLGDVKVFYGLHNMFSAVAVVGLGNDCKSYNPMEQVDERKEAIRYAVTIGIKALENVSASKVYVDSCDHAESAAEGASLGSWLYQEMKEIGQQKIIKKLKLFDSCDTTGWNIGLHKAAAQNLTRLLQETPGNNLTPCIFAQTTIDMLSKYGVSINVRMKNWAELRNLNGFLAVARGSCEAPILLEILYEGCDPTVSPVVVIGKGITFNSGGLCLRKCKEMTHGRGDMVGAAAVVATFRAIAALKLPINLVGLLPLCANLPGARAYKPGDIIRCYNGKTVLIENTGCEGLLMHADVLSYSEIYQPKLILDIGSLTPDMLGALSTSATGVFSNCDTLYELMRIASIHTGDRIWRLPLWKYFKHYMITKTTDYTNNTPQFIGGGACKAASFLSEFVPCGVDWVHMDVYNVMRSAGHAIDYLQKGMSGRPTRNLIEFLAQLSCRTSRKSDSNENDVSC